MNSLCVSENFRLLFLASLLALFFGPSYADPSRDNPPYTNCSGTANFTDSMFENNLNQTLQFLSSYASIPHFNSTSTGDEPDRVYGSFLCFYRKATANDPDNCKSCVETAVHRIRQFCPTSKEAIVWEEHCQLRYSNRSFFSLMENTTYKPQYNHINNSDPQRFSSVVRKLMDNLSEQAAFGDTHMFENGKSEFTKIDTVYGLVQCTEDLSGYNCSRCLQSTLTYILSYCNFSRGARVFGTSCYLRYELYDFVAGDPPSTNTPKESDRRKVSTPVIITIAVACVVVVLLGSCLCYLVGRKRPRKEKKNCISEASLRGMGAPNSTNFSHQNMQGRDQMKPQDFPLISLATIHTATNNFSDLNKLGQGGFGPVYKGALPDGKEVAVKRLSSISEQGSEQFMNEVLLIMKLQHKNLVRLLGCCIEAEEKILVYEYMANSSLDVFLFDPKSRPLLDWGKRFNIVTGIARGLLYLHQDSRLRIIHRDVKASNVLLDHDMNPKISDFGMARIFGGNIGEANTDIIVGTYGYMAPEYAMEGLYSIKSDVFSFGVLLLEIVTGKRNAGFHLSGRAPSLLVYAWRLWNEGKGLELMDPLLTEPYSTIEFLRCIHIGLLCVQEDAVNRPSMSSVVVMLGTESAALSQPQQPAFSVGRFVIQSDQSLDCTINELTVSGVTPR